MIPADPSALAQDRPEAGHEFFHPDAHSRTDSAWLRVWGRVLTVLRLTRRPARPNAGSLSKRRICSARRTNQHDDRGQHGHSRGDLRQAPEAELYSRRTAGNGGPGRHIFLSRPQGSSAHWAFFPGGARGEGDAHQYVVTSDAGRHAQARGSSGTRKPLSRGYNATRPRSTSTFLIHVLNTWPKGGTVGRTETIVRTETTRRLPIADRRVTFVSCAPPERCLVELGSTKGLGARYRGIA